MILKGQLNILMDMEKELGTPLYVIGSGIRERLLGEDIKRMRIAGKIDAKTLAMKFSSQIDSSEMMQRETGEYEVTSENALPFVFSTIEEETIENQLRQRIFSIDALGIMVKDFESLEKFKIIDPSGGLQDIEDRVLRVVSQDNLLANPVEFLRGIRLMAEHDLDIEAGTESIMQENVGVLQGISGREFRKEWFRILEQKDSSFYVNLMDKHIGMLRYIFPEVVDMKCVGECKYHVVDSFTHSVYTLRILEGVINSVDFFEKHLREAYEAHMSERLDSDIKRESLMKMGAFFHDVGKPTAQFQDESGRTRFRGHEIVGAEILEEMGRRLGLSEREITILSRYSLLHMYPLVIYKNNDMSGKILAEMFDKTAGETLDILLIGYADIVSTRMLLDPNEEMGNFKVHVEYMANNFLLRYLPEKEKEEKGKDGVFNG